MFGDVGLWIDFASGLFFLPLGIYAAIKQPRTTAGAWFAVFAISLAVRAMIDNAVRLLGFGETIMFWTLTITAIAMVVSLFYTVRNMAGLHRLDWWFLGFLAILAGISSLFGVAAGMSLIRSMSGGTAAAMTASLCWLIMRMASHKHDAWLAGAFVPYAASFSLVSMSAIFVDAAHHGGALLGRWVANFAVPAIFLFLAFVVLMHHHRRWAAGALAVIALATLGTTLWIGETANDSGLVGIARIAAVFALGYAIVRHRAFGIDVTVRVTISYSTVIAIIGGLFLIINESVELLLQSNDPVVALGSAVVLAFLFRPIQSGAERLAARLLPNAMPIADRDVDTRKQMYARLSEAAWADGKITEKEGRMLNEARIQLSLSATAAKAIDKSIRAKPLGS